MVSAINYAALAAPLPESAIQWRAQSFTKDGARALLLAYMDSRAVMRRLDEVCGPANWSNSFAPGPDGGVLCTISIRTDLGWVGKSDVAENTDVEAVKGGCSDAFKRAAVQWGIGRYLYDLDAQWVEVKASASKGSVYVSSKEHRGHCTPPTLPAWARPTPCGSSSSTTRTDHLQPEAEPPLPKGAAAMREAILLLLEANNIERDQFDKWLDHLDKPGLSSMDEEGLTKLFDYLEQRKCKAVKAWLAGVRI